MRLIATIALLALGLGATLPALAETNIGVTAAVNQDAKGMIGSNIKTRGGCKVRSFTTVARLQAE
jgi:hypothetical protein